MISTVDGSERPNENVRATKWWYLWERVQRSTIHPQDMQAFVQTDILKLKTDYYWKMNKELMIALC